MKNLNQLFNRYKLDGLINGCSTGSEWFGSGDKFKSISPVDGKLIGEINGGSKKDFNEIVKVSKEAFKEFRKMPAPKRGDLVRFEEQWNVRHILMMETKLRDKMFTKKELENVKSYMYIFDKRVDNIILDLKKRSFQQ